MRVEVSVAGDSDLPGPRKHMPDGNDECRLKPAAIADPFWSFAYLDRSAWTHEVDARFFKETF